MSSKVTAARACFKIVQMDLAVEFHFFHPQTNKKTNYWWEFQLFLVSQIVWLSSAGRAGSFGSPEALYFSATFSFYKSVKFSDVFTYDW